MKIGLKQPERPTISEIKFGDTFVYNTNIYMKCEKRCNTGHILLQDGWLAVRLDDGALSVFADDNLITPVQLKVVMDVEG